MLWVVKKPFRLYFNIEAWPALPSLNCCRVSVVVGGRLIPEATYVMWTRATASLTGLTPKWALATRTERQKPQSIIISLLKTTG